MGVACVEGGGDLSFVKFDLKTMKGVGFVKN